VVQSWGQDGIVQVLTGASVLCLPCRADADFERQLAILLRERDTHWGLYSVAAPGQRVRLGRKAVRLRCPKHGSRQAWTAKTLGERAEAVWTGDPRSSPGLYV
jgi:hypothetical protein